ncbi:hypothetical protein GCK32_017177 [Trichostrongylus colubriformis]|uniref:Uncharacterized protein n=1 Tax=Trichostrongylus colubriformis TaxID=6319 RepID=A0AAN8FGH4_TRICO
MTARPVVAIEDGDDEIQLFESLLAEHRQFLNRKISTKALLPLLEFVVEGRYELILRKSETYVNMKRAYKSNKSETLGQALNRFAVLLEEVTSEFYGARRYFREKEYHLKNIIDGLCGDTSETNEMK